MKGAGDSVGKLIGIICEPPRQKVRINVSFYIDLSRGLTLSLSPCLRLCQSIPAQVLCDIIVIVANLHVVYPFTAARSNLDLISFRLKRLLEAGANFMVRLVMKDIKLIIQFSLLLKFPLR